MDDKIVKFQLSDIEYKQLEEVMRQKQMNLNEAVREAIREWVRLQTPLEEDSLFSLEPKVTGVATDSGNLDKCLSKG
jgi:hypothetical protein